MQTILLSAVLLLGACHKVHAQNVAEAPLCAQTCLANATAAQDVCMGLDVKCLCSNSDFMSSLYCCLATNCSPADQQKGVDFNIASCNAVNETAPNFVGCSPLSDDDSESGTSTISGFIEPALTTFIGDVPTTADFDGRALLEGTCSDAHYAQVTSPNDEITQFAEIGCSERLAGCCPFDPPLNAVLTKCPKDYATTAGACCPSGWQVYFTEIGGQTPCFTRPSVTYVPEESPTRSDVAIVTGRLFSRKFELSEDAVEESSGLSAGVIAGIVIGALAGLGLLGGAAAIFLLKRRRGKMDAQNGGADSIFSKQPTSPSHFSGHGPEGGASEMAGTASSPTSATHELASPQTIPPSPGSPNSVWIAGSTRGVDGTVGKPRSSYEHNGGAGAGLSAGNPPKPPRNQAREGPAQELPGSTFIYEHHPAYSPPHGSRGQDSAPGEKRGINTSNDGASILSSTTLGGGSAAAGDGVGVRNQHPPPTPTSHGAAAATKSPTATTIPHSSPPRTPPRTPVSRTTTMTSAMTAPTISLPPAGTAISTAGTTTATTGGAGGETSIRASPSARSTISTRSVSPSTTTTTPQPPPTVSPLGSPKRFG